MEAIATLVAARLSQPELSVNGMHNGTHLSEGDRALGRSEGQFQGQFHQSEAGILPAGESAFAPPFSEERIASVPLVATAALELQPLPLHAQIQQFAERAIAQGYRSVKILPLFLLAGVHVAEDIPAEVAIAQRQLGQRIELKQCTYVGFYSQIQHLIVNAFEVPDQIPVNATKILVAHGSRRSQGNDTVEAIAQDIGAVTAYWSLAPSLEDRVLALSNMGYRDIAVLPYFLFAGGITDAIAQKVEQLSDQFPKIHFYLAQPLGARPAFADQIAALLQSDDASLRLHCEAIPHGR